jgi:hypothetical protein
MPVKDLPNLCLECSVECFVDDAEDGDVVRRVATVPILAGLCVAFAERKKAQAEPTICVFCGRRAVCATHADPDEADEVPS